MVLCRQVAPLGDLCRHVSICLFGVIGLQSAGTGVPQAGIMLLLESLSRIPVVDDDNDIGPLVSEYPEANGFFDEHRRQWRRNEASAAVVADRPERT